MMQDHLDRTTLADFEALAGAERDAALAHLRDCGACRAAWIAEEPSRVFALLAASPIPEHRLEALSSRVAAGIRPRRPARWFGAASIAASLLFAAVLGGVMWNRELPEPLPRFDEIGILEPLSLGDENNRLVALPGEDASVVDLTIGETQVLLIFDESIEL